MYAGVISSVEMLSRSVGCVAVPTGACGSKGRSSPASCRRTSAASSVRKRIRPSKRTRSGSVCTGRVSRLLIMVARCGSQNRFTSADAPCKNEPGPRHPRAGRDHAYQEFATSRLRDRVTDVAAPLAAIAAEIVRVVPAVAPVGAQVALVAAGVRAVATQIGTVPPRIRDVAPVAVVSQLAAVLADVPAVPTLVAPVAPDLPVVTMEIAPVAADVARVLVDLTLLPRGVDLLMNLGVLPRGVDLLLHALRTRRGDHHGQHE